MLLSIETYIIMGVLILIPIGYLIYDLYFKNKNIVKILLFEKVGSIKTFKGVYKAVEKSNKLLGNYLSCKKVGIVIATPNVENFFPSSKYKTLALCQFGTADFRIMKVLRDKTYYTKLKQAIIEEVTIPNPDNPEEDILIEKPVLKAGKPVYEEVENYYNDPIGITQEAQEVSRFNRSFRQEMDDFMKKEPSIWDRYGALLINGMVIVSFMIFVIFLLRKNADLQTDMITQFGKASDEYINEVKSPSFINSLVTQFEKEKVEAQAPLT